MGLFIRLLLCVLIHQSLFHQPGSSYNIVFYHGVATSSHRAAIWPLAARLADLGHNITYIFPMEHERRQGSHPAILEIAPSKHIQINREVMGDIDINIKLESRVDEWLQTVFSRSVQLCEAFYDSPETQQWLKTPGLKVDLFVIDVAFGECAFGLVHRFPGAKHILYAPLVCPFVYEGFGVIPESSSIPDVMVSYAPRGMSLLARAWNTIMPLLFRANILVYRAGIEPILKENVGQDMPEIAEFERNTSLVFHNNYFIEAHAEALPPQFISMSGLLCKHVVKPLPNELAEFLKDSDFVYISFGSAVTVGNMPTSLRNKFFSAFRSFPNLKFFWRWTDAPVPEDTPANALLAPWFPQRDLLGHPKIRAFVTQAGRPSSQEALCAGVPQITIPIVGDQGYNANRLEMIGAAIQLDIMTLTAEHLSNAIQEAAFNPKRKEVALTLSKMYKDRPVDPLDNLVYWTEYTLRYDTSIMRSLGAEQTWYERRLLDVYGVLALAFLTIVGLLVTITTWIIRKCVNLLRPNDNIIKNKVD